MASLLPSQVDLKSTKSKVHIQPFREIACRVYKWSRFSSINFNLQKHALNANCQFTLCLNVGQVVQITEKFAIVHHVMYS